MNERGIDVVSIFNGVDQAAMLDRLAESPLEDAEIGFLSDCDETGRREVSESLLVGIRIFAGLGLNPDSDTEPLPEQAGAEVDQPHTADDGKRSRASFILFGPAGQAVSST